MLDRHEGPSNCWHCPAQPSEHRACGCLCHISPKEFVARATAFVASVGNPSAPAYCPWCFNLMAYEISRSSERVTQIQRAIPQFFETSMRLLVLYSDGDTSRLRERLTSNQLRCPERPTMHRRRLIYSLTDALDIFLLALFITTHCGLASGKRALDSAANCFKPHFYKRAGHWPTGLADLFPCGVEAGIIALVYWCCVLPCSEPFGLLSSVLSVSRPVSMPYLLNSPTRERIIWAVLHAVQHGTVPWPGSAPFRTPRALPPQRAIRGTLETVAHVLELLSTVMGSKDNRTHDVVQLVSGFEQLLLGALGPHLARHSRMGSTPDGHLPRGLIVCDFLDLLRVLLEPGPVPDRPPRRDVIRASTVLLHIVRSCGNVACGANELSEERMARFRRCEFCELVRYCSRDCQKADWNVGVAGISHRMVCPILVKLQSTQDALEAEGEDDAEVDYFMRAFEACDFDPHDEDIFHRWSLARGVAPASRFTLPYPRHV